MDMNLIKQTGIKGTAIMGIVFNPVTGEFFSAIAGEGAFLNNRPIQVSDTRVMQESLLATGFPYDLLLRCYHYST